jgi:hypothetical protein
VAGAIAETARQHEACGVYRMTDQKRALESPAYIYISNAGATSYQNADERIVLDARHGEELSAQLPVQDPTHYIADTTSDAPDGPLVTTFDPGNAILLEDGRVAIPGTKLFASEPEDPFYPGSISIFTNESGEWLLDERVAFCVGDCEEHWAKMVDGRVVYDATPGATPIATPED